MSSRVAKDFMSARPTTIGSTQTIFEAAKMMKDKSCGALPVFHEQDKTKIVGILTDRDIVVRVIAAGSDPKNIKVRKRRCTGESLHPFSLLPLEQCTLYLGCRCHVQGTGISEGEPAGC
jgi:predicted transcriptional regulator